VTAEHMASIRWSAGIGQGKSAALRAAVNDAVTRGIRPISYLCATTDVGLRTERVDAASDETSAALGTTQLRGRLVRSLSSGERQRMRLTAALCGPVRLTALDEPCRHLDPGYVDALNELLAKAKQRGAAVLACDVRRALADGLFDQENGWVKAAPALPREAPVPRGEPITIEIGTPFLLSSTGRSSGKLNVKVAQGSLVIVRGPNGGGKTSLLEAIARSARSAGVRFGYCRQEPEHQVFAPSPQEEIDDIVAAHAHAPSWAAMSPRRPTDCLAQIVQTLGLASWLSRPTPGLPLGVLSQLGVAIALWMGSDMVLLDEPTQGLDAAGAEALARQLAWVVEHGARVVVATHDPILVAMGNVFWSVEQGTLRTGAAP
jgi:ABC-type Mn2+/Zn2+ transport system ATPase subunit